MIQFSLEVVLVLALHEGRFAAFQNVGGQLLDHWQVDGTLQLLRDVTRSIQRLEDANPLCIAKDRDVGVVGGEKELAIELGPAKLLNNAVGDEGVVEIVFRLVEHERILIA